MGHEQQHVGQHVDIKDIVPSIRQREKGDFVLDKDLFVSIFEKDIRRIFIYKKAERLAKAIYLIRPAFSDSLSLRDRLDIVAANLIDAAARSPRAGRTTLSRELLTLSSLLSVARTSGILSMANADLISREAQLFLHEIASYEDPRLSIDEPATLSAIAKSVRPKKMLNERNTQTARAVRKGNRGISDDKNEAGVKDRRGAILSVIKDKEKTGIKDISAVVRGVSEKTIQRELSALIRLGIVSREGSRRWSIYSLA